MRPLLLRPLFSFAKTTMHSDVLLTPLEQYWDHEPWDPEWDKKAHAKAVWRGSTTGVWFDRGTWWRSSQRVRLWFMGKDKTGTRRVRFSGEGLETAPGVESLVEKRVATQQLMEHYVDFAFTGREGQCDVDDGSCAAVKKLFDFQRTFGWNEANDYKYLLDLDGNAWSGRFHRLLSSNSAVIKSTIFPEWCVLSLSRSSTSRSARADSCRPPRAGTPAGSSPGCSASLPSLSSSSPPPRSSCSRFRSSSPQLHPAQGRLLGPVRHHGVLCRRPRRPQRARRPRQADRRQRQGLRDALLALRGHGGLCVAVLSRLPRLEKVLSLTRCARFRSRARARRLLPPRARVGSCQLCVPLLPRCPPRAAADPLAPTLQLPTGAAWTTRARAHRCGGESRRGARRRTSTSGERGGRTRRRASSVPSAFPSRTFCTPLTLSRYAANRAHAIQHLARGHLREGREEERDQARAPALRASERERQVRARARGTKRPARTVAARETRGRPARSVLAEARRRCCRTGEGSASPSRTRCERSRERGQSSASATKSERESAP